MSDEAQQLPPGDVAPIAAEQQAAEPTMLEKAMDTIHDLEAKVEHLIHPGDPVVTAGPTIADAMAKAGTPLEADVPNAAPAVAAPTTARASAPSADGAATTSPSAASSAGDLATFKQMVEERFQHLEAALMGLPTSIHAVMSQGSMEAEDFGKAVLAHLFSKL